MEKVGRRTHVTFPPPPSRWRIAAAPTIDAGAPSLAVKSQVQTRRRRCPRAWHAHEPPTRRGRTAPVQQAMPQCILCRPAPPVPSRRRADPGQAGAHQPPRAMKKLWPVCASCESHDDHPLVCAWLSAFCSQKRARPAPPPAGGRPRACARTHMHRDPRRRQGCCGGGKHRGGSTERVPVNVVCIRI